MKWSESAASKCRYSKYTEEMFKNWEIVWDYSTAPTSQSPAHFAEFVAVKDGQIAYMKYAYSSNPTRDKLEKMTDDERRRAISMKVEVFTEAADFRSWVEHRNDNRLRRISL